jgi:hypothetical protein
MICCILEICYFLHEFTSSIGYSTAASGRRDLRVAVIAGAEGGVQVRGPLLSLAGRLRVFPLANVSIARHCQAVRLK